MAHGLNSTINRDNIEQEQYQNNKNIKIEINPTQYQQESTEFSTKMIKREFYDYTTNKNCVLSKNNNSNAICVNNSQLMKAQHNLNDNLSVQQSSLPSIAIATPPATKMGSRRIFTPQFKLQVLESYRNDSECKGNQRATARKYGIHRRQIQKWLQCETNLRSSVANLQQNNVKHQFHNVSHERHHQSSSHNNSNNNNNNNSNNNSNNTNSNNNNNKLINLHSNQHTCNKNKNLIETARHNVALTPISIIQTPVVTAANNLSLSMIATTQSLTTSTSQISIRSPTAINSNATNTIPSGIKPTLIPPLIQTQHHQQQNINQENNVHNIMAVAAMHHPQYTYTPANSNVTGVSVPIPIIPTPYYYHPHHQYQLHMHHHHHQQQQQQQQQEQQLENGLIMPSSRLPVLSSATIPHNNSVPQQYSIQAPYKIPTAPIPSNDLPLYPFNESHSHLNQTENFASSYSNENNNLYSHNKDKETYVKPQCPIDLSLGKKIEEDIVVDVISNENDASTNNSIENCIRFTKPTASAELIKTENETLIVDLSCKRKRTSSNSESGLPRKIQKIESPENQQLEEQPVKLFKPYLLDNNELKSSDKLEQKDPIIWSNHPNGLNYDSHSNDSTFLRQDGTSTNSLNYAFPAAGSPTFQYNTITAIQSPVSPLSTSGFWCPKGSPVSGYETASIHSDCSDYQNNTKSPIRRISHEQQLIENDYKINHKIEMSEENFCNKNEIEQVAKSSGTDFMHHNKLHIQRWLNHDGNSDSRQSPIFG